MASRGSTSDKQKPAAKASMPRTPPSRGQASAASAGPAAPKLMKPTAAEIVEALSWARTKPKEVAEILQARLKFYKGMDYFPPEREGRCVVTKEGSDVVKEAIEFVLSQETELHALQGPEQGLSLAAEDHLADIGESGTASHTSSDGTGAADRVKRYGTFKSFGECLWYGTEQADARNVVLDLIVDDGVPSRGHRKGVLNAGYDIAGVACGHHSTFGKMAVIEFASGWQGKEASIEARVKAGPVKISKEVMAKAKAEAKTQWNDIGACLVCREQIKGGKVVDVPQLGGKLHADCFTCRTCSTSLAGGQFQVHEEPKQGKKAYCTACYGEKFATRCAACEKPIVGTMMKCSLGSFHKECAVCSTCKKPIGGQSMTTSGGVLQCQTCAGGLSTGTAGRPRGAASKPTGAAPVAKGQVLAAAGSQISGPAAKAKAKAKPKPQAKSTGTSMSQAKATTVLVGMDYMGLD